MQRCMVRVSLVLLVVLAFSGCAILNWLGVGPAPQDRLMTTWLFDPVATDMTDYDSPEPHPDLPFHTIQFEADGFTIFDVSNAVVDQSGITNLNDDGFNYETEIRTDHPTYVGNTGYVRYTIEPEGFTAEGRRLSLFFYTDATMTTEAWRGYCDEMD